MNFKEWLHDGLKDNFKYSIFIDSIIPLRICNLNEAAEFNPLSKDIDAWKSFVKKPDMARFDESQRSLVNVEVDHRILQFAKKMAEISKDNVADFMKKKNPEYINAEKQKKPLENIPTHVSMFPIYKSKVENKVEISDENEFQEVCRKYLKYFPKIDDVYNKDLEIDVFEKLVDAAKIETNDPYQAVQIFLTNKLVLRDSKIKHKYENIKFKKNEHTEMFNRFNKGTFDRVMALTISMRVNAIEGKSNFESDKKIIEVVWLSLFSKSMKNTSRYISREIEKDRLVKFLRDRKLQDIAKKPSSKTIVGTEGEHFKDEAVEALNPMMNKVQEIINNIQNYNIPNKHLLFPTEYVLRRQNIVKIKNTAKAYKNAIMSSLKEFAYHPGSLSRLYNKNFKDEANKINATEPNPENHVDMPEIRKNAMASFNKETFPAILKLAALQLDNGIEGYFTKYVNEKILQTIKKKNI